jgi:hypothetical protein
VLVAPRAILLPLDALWVQALVLVGEIVAVFTIVAGENDLFSRHTNSKAFRAFGAFSAYGALLCALSASNALSAVT